MTNTYAGKQFQTASFRRKGKPLTFQVQHWLTDPERPEDEGREVEVTLMVDPLLDTIRLGAAFGSFGASLQGFSDPGVPAEEKMATLDREVPKVKAALRQCLVPPSRLLFDEAEDDGVTWYPGDAIDVSMMGELVRWMMQELSGLDPTQLTASPDGSSPTSAISTGTPPPAG